MNRYNIFSTNIDVRFRDLDAMGHVNNSVFFTYFEEGRIDFSHKVFNISDPSGFSFIMAHIRCDFLLPVKLGHRLTLQMWVNSIGKKSFGYGYKLVERSDESVIFALGESIQVCYDYTENKSIPVPDEMKAKLSTYLKE